MKTFVGLVMVVMGMASASPAQWTLQESGSTASLRGIDAVSREVAWASGSGGTVLKTVDGGKHWTKCAVPEGAEKLDFRGVQAFDAKTAIVMSSGPGDASRLYKTIDGCGTWKLLMKNTDKDGFWDALIFQNRKRDQYHGQYAVGMLLGDPAHGSFYLALTHDGGEHWTQQQNDALKASGDAQGAFAASNTSLILHDGAPIFASGGTAGAFVFALTEASVCLRDCPDSAYEGHDDKWAKAAVDVGDKTQGAGVFSIAEGDPKHGLFPAPPDRLIVVGGNYSKPDDGTRSAAFSSDRGLHWQTSTSMPHGYRSAVAWDESTKAWITVGPNGTDASFDDGKNWKPLRPGKGEAPNADQHWDALSLPFVVGSKGRIGVLREEAVAGAREKP